MNIKDKLKAYTASQQIRESGDTKPSTITLPIEEYKRLKAIEGAATEAYDHFAYLSRLGSLTGEEDEVIEALGKALLPHD